MNIDNYPVEQNTRLAEAVHGSPGDKHFVYPVLTFQFFFRLISSFFLMSNLFTNIIVIFSCLDKFSLKISLYSTPISATSAVDRSDIFKNEFMFSFIAR